MCLTGLSDKYKCQQATRINNKYSQTNITKASYKTVDNVENVQNVYSLIHNHVKANIKAQPSTTLLPAFPKGSSFTTHAHDSNKSPLQLQDANIPLEIQCKLHTMLTSTYTGIISKSPADFGRTNLTEMDLPTTGPPVSIKPYTIPLKYKSVDDEIKLLQMLAAFLSHSATGHM